jgi:hypothetical protein
MSDEDTKDTRTIGQEIATEIEPVSSEELISLILARVDEQNALTSMFMDGYVFNGKTLNEWRQELYVEIPLKRSSLSPEVVVELHLRIARNIQRANNLYAAANATQTSLEASASVKRSEIVNALVDIYEKRGAKRPAAGVLNQMAETLVDYAYVKAGSHILKTFFKDSRETLIEVRKSLEQVSFMLHLEQKLQ